jgi:hypothetical protein
MAFLLRWVGAFSVGALRISWNAPGAQVTPMTSGLKPRGEIGGGNHWAFWVRSAKTLGTATAVGWHAPFHPGGSIAVSHGRAQAMPIRVHNPAL